MHLPETGGGARVATRLFETEKQRIGDGTMRPVGLRLVARR